MSLVGALFRTHRCLSSSFRSLPTGTLANTVLPEQHSRHKRYLPIYDLTPEVGEHSYVAPNSVLAGEVYIDDYVNVWDRSVIRGDLNAVRIHYMAAIKENVTISTVSSLPTGAPSIVSIGKIRSPGPFSVVQAGCSLVSCEIGSQVLIGARSVVLEGAKIEDEAVVGPDSVVPPGRLIPGHQLWAGNPVRYVRDLTKAEIWTIKVLAHEK